MSRVQWPEGKQFAFTVFDDTDSATLENVCDVYSYLEDCGLRTTKSVWPIQADSSPNGKASTCQDPEYLEWVLRLQRSGFDIGWHMASHGTSSRGQTVWGLEKFAEIFKDYPRAMANHAECEENIYWGDSRVSGSRRWIYNLLTRNRNKAKFRGHVDGDELFWGDICQQLIRYVRNFDFPDINTLKECPIMPYHDPDRSYVNYWYASTDGHDAPAFNRRVSEANQDRLEDEGGACIMYTHFARGFVVNGQLDRRFRLLMGRLARKNGWFVPVSTLLDFLLKTRGPYTITPAERRRLEWKWLKYKVAVGTA